MLGTSWMTPERLLSKRLRELCIEGSTYWQGWHTVTVTRASNTTYLVRDVGKPQRCTGCEDATRRTLMLAETPRTRQLPLWEAA